MGHVAHDCSILKKLGIKFIKSRVLSMGTSSLKSESCQPASAPSLSVPASGSAAASRESVVGSRRLWNTG